MVDAYGWSLWVFIGGVGRPARAGRRPCWRGPARRTPLGAAQVGFGVVFVVGLLWSFKAFNGLPDAFFLLPESILGIGGIVAVLAKRLPATRRAGGRPGLGRGGDRRWP